MSEGASAGRSGQVISGAWRGLDEKRSLMFGDMIAVRENILTGIV